MDARKKRFGQEVRQRVCIIADMLRNLNVEHGAPFVVIIIGCR